MYVEQLDFRNETDVQRYEEGFYHAFFPFSNPGIRAIWLWDDRKKRLKTRIPYDEQRVFFMRDDQGSISAAVALNFALRKLQFEYYYFERPNIEEKWLESLLVFNTTGDVTRRLTCSEVARKVCLDEGYRFLYGTCSEKVLSLHQRDGFKAIARNEILSVVRYFLMIDLTISFFRSGVEKKSLP